MRCRSKTGCGSPAAVGRIDRCGQRRSHRACGNDGRSAVMAERICPNSARSAIISAMWKAIERPCRPILAPILTNRSRSVVGDQCMTSRTARSSVGSRRGYRPGRAVAPARHSWRTAWLERIARQLPPWAAGPQNVGRRIHCRAHVGLARSTAGCRRRGQGFQSRPMRVGQVAGKATTRPAIRRSVFVHPHHLPLCSR